MGSPGISSVGFGYGSSGGSPTKSGQLTIVKTFEPNVGSRASPGAAFGGDPVKAAGFFDAVDAACANYESRYCVNVPVKVYIQFGFGTIGGGLPMSSALGQSMWYLEGFSYAQIRAAMIANAVSDSAKAAAATLPSVDPTGGASSYYLTTGHSKIVKLDSGAFLDGWASISPTQTYFWHETDPPSGFDATGVLEHEIGENIGREGAREAGTCYIMDLFSYSAPNTRMMNAVGGYFSFDNGTTVIETYNTNPSGDTDDWDGEKVSCFNAFSGGGLQNMTDEDIRVMDGLGLQGA